MTAREAPIIVLCTARSGSTMLRYLLDAHPMIACPPEVRMGSVLTSVSGLWRDVLGSEGHSEGRAAARGAVEAVMDRYVQQRGKRTWCDKSVSTVPSLDAITTAFPDARYLCLYRHPMDMIASGMEASRWGYGRFGFQPYVEERPGNLVGALAQYWIDRTSKILECEDARQVKCHRITYETLVAQPVDTLRSILAFLGLDSGTELLQDMVTRAFVSSHGDGLRDFKADYTASVQTSSVGRGRAVPEYLVQGIQRDALKALCRRLGYEEIGGGWNTGWPVPAPDPQAAEAPSPVASVVAALAQGLTHYSGPRTGPFCLAVAEEGHRWRWCIDTADRTIEPLAPCQPADDLATWTTHVVVLLQLATGELDPAQAMHWALVKRHSAGEENPGDGDAERKVLAALFTSIRHSRLSGW
jgi:protein-tyrosine sulfotransferase